MSLTKDRSSQHWLGKTRPPRVQITFDVDAYGDPKIELPFLMGVLGDFSGADNAQTNRTDIEDLREIAFDEIDVDDFDKVLKDYKPRVKFDVPNTVTGQGQIEVDLTFGSLDDFSPEAVARKVDVVKNLMANRDELLDGLRFADKGPIRKFFAKVSSDPELRKIWAELELPEKTLVEEPEKEEEE